MKTVQRVALALKRRIAPTDVFQLIRPLLSLLFWLGILPVKIVERKGRRQLRTSWKGFVVTATLTLALFGSWYIRERHEDVFSSIFFGNSKKLSKVGIFQEFRGVAVLFTITMVGIYKRHALMSVIHLMDEADRMLSEIGMQLRYGKRFFWLMFRFLGVISWFLGFGLRSLQMRSHIEGYYAYVVFIPFVLVFFHLMSVIQLYYALLEEIRYRFWCVNKVSDAAEAVSLPISLVRYTGLDDASRN